IVHTHVNSLAAIKDLSSMQQCYVDEYEENLYLRSELAKKNDMVEKAVYNELSKRCLRIEQRCISLEIKLQQTKESFQINSQSINQATLEFQEFFKINELQAQLEAKELSIKKLQAHIANLKGKNVVASAPNVNNSNVIVSNVYKLDLEPIPLVLRHNKDAHLDYLAKMKEHTDTLRGIVEQAKKQYPGDSYLEYACKFTIHVQELLVYLNASCLCLKVLSEKLVAVTPLNRTRKVRFGEPRVISQDRTPKQISTQEKQTTNSSMLPSTGVKSSTKDCGSKPRSNTRTDRIPQPSRSDKKQNKVEVHHRNAKSSLNKMNHISNSVCNLNVQQSVLNANSELMCTTCNECMFDSVHDSCVRAYLNNADDSIKSKSMNVKSAKSKNKKIWKSTGQVFTNVGYRWIPTCRNFTIDGNTFPLTRITSTSAIPPKKQTPTPVVKTVQHANSKLGNSQDKTKAGPISKSKKVATKISNILETMPYWGSKVSTAPSSSNVCFRSSKLSYGTSTRAARSTGHGSALSSSILSANSWVQLNSVMIKLQK
ncbi:hypothetical protein Tco_1455232, partial [Tanacetum coccineum]